MFTANPQFRIRESQLSAIRGNRVTVDQLTVGRWYQVASYTRGGNFLHAQYLSKEVKTFGTFYSFKVCIDDVAKFGVDGCITRNGGAIADNLPIYKFTTHPNKAVSTAVAAPDPVPEPEPLPEIHPVDALKADIDSVLAQASKLSDEANALEEQARTLRITAETKRQELAALLKGYLPAQKQSVW